MVMVLMMVSIVRGALYALGIQQPAHHKSKREPTLLFFNSDAVFVELCSA